MIQNSEVPKGLYPVQIEVTQEKLDKWYNLHLNGSMEHQMLLTHIVENNIQIGDKINYEFLIEAAEEVISDMFK